MPAVPLLKPHEVVKTFEKLGWEVPNHPEVARGTLRSLITKAGISVEEFLAAFEK